MKKKVLIFLSIIIIVLFGIFIYESSNQEKYSIDEYETEKEKIEHDDNVEDLEELTEEDKQLEEDIKNSNKKTIIPELEDLSNEKYKGYSLYNFDNLELNKPIKEGLIEIQKVGESEPSIKIKLEAQENFNLIKNSIAPDNMYQFFNDTGNVFGNFVYTGIDYNKDEILSIFKEGKKGEQSLVSSGEYTNYKYGDIQEFEYKGYKGLYNCREYSIVSNFREDGVPKQLVKPPKYKYDIYFNYNGTIIYLNLNTYQNCSYGQKTVYDLIDSSIKFE